eukprot:TRINITY_DN4113_c0_g1_i1.p1 TRINITY_DN4113_c0_g1~~TRINITY_DN4113_c0_g1_i1.p1  ORF type:complete len:692 (-),score=165.56 TRINITY_DN4113_c0_g1_i1:62-2137(-)
MAAAADIASILANCLPRGLPLNPLPPPSLDRDPSVPHAPVRVPNLTEKETKLALRNVLRYFPAELHATLAPEFAAELKEYGHIYCYRFRPTEYEMKAYPLSVIPGKTVQARCIIHMILNNLDNRVAQFPHELITYGGNGAVFSNWVQYHIVMGYLTQMTETQTLSMYSGHPMGLFPSSESAPRVVVTNGMVIPNYSSKAEFEKEYALGVTMYGQMTAGSYAYIGPQGIVHGTTLTLLNAARKYLNLNDLSGLVFVSSGLGGMSGAQAKAAVIVGAIGVIAEVDESALRKRHQQGWVMEVCVTAAECVARIRVAKQKKEALSIGFLGNVITLWEELLSLAEQGELLVELGSDQTSLHNPYSGGYYPHTLSFSESQNMMVSHPLKFKEHVQSSLRYHVDLINKLAAKGMKFWDYGNSFLLEARRANADILNPETGDFRFPSYVQDIMGDIFSLGFGPFRWICASGSPEDLETTDRIAGEVVARLKSEAPPLVAAQFADNLLWIQSVAQHKLVVGSQARILYCDAQGRSDIAVAFNRAIAEGRVSGPVVLSRDHHDVSGTDAPFRETSNITDGSMFCADMAIQNVIGDSFRGATWVSIHNGGGTGWGEAINGGFGLVLDGSAAATQKAQNMLFWDVNNGVARRAWDTNSNALFCIKRAMEARPDLVVTLPTVADDAVLSTALRLAGTKRKHGEI